MTAPAVTTQLVIRALGTPAPQGSFFGKVIGTWVKPNLVLNPRAMVVADNKATAPWRKAVLEAADSAKLAHDWLQLNDACAVEIVFYLERPAAAKNRAWPAVRPDLDKYVRSTLDALTAAHIFADDSRVVRLVAEKRYVEAGQRPGARIVVSPMTEALL